MPDSKEKASAVKGESLHSKPYYGILTYASLLTVGSRRRLLAGVPALEPLLGRDIQICFTGIGFHPARLSVTLEQILLSPSWYLDIFIIASGFLFVNKI